MGRDGLSKKDPALNQKLKRKVWLWLPFSWCLWFIFVQLQPFGGLIGHDYYHQFSRFLIGALHFWQNTFDVPHYTASLCGGIPFFADPQSSYYSLPQFLTFFVEPLLATQISILVCYVLGYLGMLRLVGRVFGYSDINQHLSALIFVLNGFAFSHLFVGHLTHHTFLLFSWLLYFLFEQRNTHWDLYKHAASFSVILAYMVYSGGLHMIIVFLVLMVLVFPYRCHKTKQEELLSLGEPNQNQLFLPPVKHV